jgi:hypothetical protein
MQRKVCYKVSISMGLLMTAALIFSGMGLSEEQQNRVSVEPNDRKIRLC